MLRSTIHGVFLAVGIGASLMAQTNPAAGGYCAGLPWFGPQDSLNTADLRVENKDLRVQVSAKGPELHLQLEPAIANGVIDNNLHRAGWIRVFSCKTGILIQSLEVRNYCGPECFLRFFEMRDADFDGYLDVAVVQERGALSGRQTWWAFSPAWGKFISNDFTKALSRIVGNGLEFDSARHNIMAWLLTGPGRCGSWKDIYHVEQGGRLVLVHKEEVTPTWDASHSYSVGCVLTTRELVSGQMQVTKVQRFPESAN